MTRTLCRLFAMLCVAAGAACRPNPIPLDQTVDVASRCVEIPVVLGNSDATLEMSVVSGPEVQVFLVPANLKPQIDAYLERDPPVLAFTAGTGNWTTKHKATWRCEKSEYILAIIRHSNQTASEPSRVHVRITQERAK